jgi:hypothetical protein
MTTISKRRSRMAQATAALAVLGCTLGACGGTAPAPRSRVAAATVPGIAASTNAACAKAPRLVAGVVDVLTRLQRGRLTPAAADPLLASQQSALGALVRGTTADVMQEVFTQLYDALSAFRATLNTPRTATYDDTRADLLGQAVGFRRSCPVSNFGFENGAGGWAAATGASTLASSSTAKDGVAGLQVTNGTSAPATVGFTSSPPWVASTLRGGADFSVWVRGVGGSATVTISVRELAGSTTVGTAAATVSAGPAGYVLVDVPYRVHRPGATRLSVTVTAASVAPGAGFLADDAVIARI